MNLNELNLLTKEWIQHLSSRSSFNLDDLIELSKRNRRVRNAILFYLYSDDTCRKQFENRVKNDPELNKYRQHFAKALVRLSHEQGEVSEVAKLLKKKHFAHMNPLVDSKYDVSAEMAKFFKTMLNSKNLKMSDEKRAYRDKVLRNVDMDNLLD